MNKTRKLRIGVSATFRPMDPTHPIIKNYQAFSIDASVNRWLQQEPVQVFLIPPFHHLSDIKEWATSYAHILDGLVLQGGDDISPLRYNQMPEKKEWAGNEARDGYEFPLFEAFFNAKKPIFGICRGMQLINVIFGGSLYQDLPSQTQYGDLHRKLELYDQHTHLIRHEPGSFFEKHFGKDYAFVNSIHHQGVRDLGRGLSIQSRSLEDQQIEAIYLENDPDSRFVMGVQWHPEYDLKLSSGKQLDNKKLLHFFLKECLRRKV